MHTGNHHSAREELFRAGRRDRSPLRNMHHDMMSRHESKNKHSWKHEDDDDEWIREREMLDYRWNSRESSPNGRGFSKSPVRERHSRGSSMDREHSGRHSRGSSMDREHSGRHSRGSSPNRSNVVSWRPLPSSHCRSESSCSPCGGTYQTHHTYQKPHHAEEKFVHNYTEKQTEQHGPVIHGTRYNRNDTWTMRTPVYHSKESGKHTLEDYNRWSRERHSRRNSKEFVPRRY